MPDILIDNEEHRVVALSRSFSYARYREVQAQLHECGDLTLVSLRDDGKSKRFILEAAEVDALIEAIGDHKTYLKLLKEKQEREDAEKFERLKERIAALGGTLTLSHEKLTEHDWNRYSLKFAGCWAHCGMPDDNVHNIEWRVASIESDLAREAEREARILLEPEAF